MLIHPLDERLRHLGMAAMADAFLELQTSAAAVDLTREDWLGLLLDREATERYERRLRARLRYARLRHQAEAVAKCALERPDHQTCISHCEGPIAQPFRPSPIGCQGGKNV